jgi:hypothetical protein
VADELPVGALDLFLDVELGEVEVDQFPGEAEQLAPAQAEDQDEDVGAVELITLAAGGFKELACLVN